MYDDEIWDEHRWEDFLSENDRQIDRRLTLYYAYLARHPRPEDGQKPDAQSWFRGLQRYFAENGLREDDAFLRLFLPDDDETPAPVWPHHGDADVDSEEPTDDPESLDDLNVYKTALDLSVDLLRWSDDLPITDKDSTFVQFCTSVTQIPTNIAKGHGMGFERDMIGGNIACTKRGLQSANEALDLLTNLKKEPFFDDSTYFTLYERLFEIRNQLGIYVQALRERFDLGID